MSSVILRSVSKSFGTTRVVDDVSFEIADGEFVVLVGPSGCGKSTLLRMIAGLEAISRGEIAIDGRVVNDIPPKDRDVAMVFQNYALYPHMTVAENMGFSLRLRGERREVVDRKVREAAGVLGLTPYLERLPKQLSGGQRQRVAMGRSMVRAPRVLLLDEPLSNLDALLRVQMRAEIKAMHQRVKTTTVHVTHDQVEAMTMADRIVVLHDGRVEQIGAPLEIYDRPANVFVATFIGSPAMNVLDGEIVADGDAGARAVLLEGGCRLPIASPGLEIGRRVRCGLRPEHFAFAPHGVPATALVVEPTGVETHMLMRLGESQVLGIFRERLALRPGDTFTVSVDPRLVHLFGADGVRIES